MNLRVTVLFLMIDLCKFLLNRLIKCHRHIICFLSNYNLFTPILEELTFRGYFDQYFFKNNQIWLKSIISSIIYSVLYATNLIEIIIYFTME
ncbi:CPBP family glutamic-type intramembrane protease [Streptococcus hyovaginalis]|uniref:CPBP family glutamic-type intramembrane protease n=2 Tax=Streptococcus hyovaginalis TaxID=149015 RepID=UPI00147936AA